MNTNMIICLTLLLAMVAIAYAGDKGGSNIIIQDCWGKTILNDGGKGDKKGGGNIILKEDCHKKEHHHEHIWGEPVWGHEEWGHWGWK